MENKIEKIRRYSLPIVALTLISCMIMVKSGLISEHNMKYGLLVPAALELIFITLCLINITKIIRRYRELKCEGWAGIDAFQKSLEIIVSPRIARLASLEFRLYYALYLSYKKRPSGNNDCHFSTLYNSYGFLVNVFIFLCFLEIIAVTIIIPNQWMTWKLLHLVLGLWSILWLWADYRAIGIYDHVITQEGITFRIGMRCSQEIVWKQIKLVRKISQTSPGGSMGPRIPKNHPGVLYLGMGDLCNIEVNLKEPQSFQGMINDIKAVSILLLSLENPDAFIAGIKSIYPSLITS